MLIINLHLYFIMGLLCWIFGSKPRVIERIVYVNGEKEVLSSDEQLRLANIRSERIRVENEINKEIQRQRNIESLQAYEQRRLLEIEAARQNELNKQIEMSRQLALQLQANSVPQWQIDQWNREKRRNEQAIADAKLATATATAIAAVSILAQNNRPPPAAPPAAPAARPRPPARPPAARPPARPPPARPQQQNVSVTVVIPDKKDKKDEKEVSESNNSTRADGKKN
jgi:hypothetical protein